MDIYINGSGIKTAEEFHKVFAKAAHAPSYYGGNLDALYDVLTEMRSAKIKLTHVREMKESLGDHADRIIETLRDAAEENRGLNVVIK